ncbi:PREDICTED: transient receptor potential cation channel protein painless-like [Nicrophorus vespilloides]|uniref:Transient receptor potential cation channel protein painless-like n=1 Tax=Nicrophorus vespilloides TaxID=110193 RepID=A0ABM1NHC1_NICVS|nr:PREDICTED: transient receptor potential cation channel protein painless-like [Nicrophorus vespilloides]
MEELLISVQNNDHNSINSILDREPELLNETIDFNAKILHKACYDYANKVTAATIQLLIDRGAAVDATKRNNNWIALHCAAMGQNPEILQVIVDNTNNINALDKYDNNALQLLVRDGNDKCKSLIECAKILIDADINVEQSNNKNYTARTWIGKKHIKELSELLPSEKIGPNELLKREIRQSIFDRDLNAFLSNIEKYENADDFFDLVIGNNFPEGLNYILSNGGNILKERPTVLSHVALMGYHEIFKLLLLDTRTIYTDDVLLQILKYMDGEKQPGIDPNACYRLLLQKCRDRVDVNYQDDRGNYVLAIASKYAGSKITKELLQSGASLANKDHDGVLSISDMDLNTLKEYFDSCITCSKIETDKTLIIMTYDYNSLLPTKKPKINKDVELGNVTEYDKETEVILFISRSPELRSLLLHPYLSSFIYMKWHKLSYIFYSNLLFYIFFCIALILFIIIPHSILLIYTINSMSGILLIREIFQVFIDFKKYSTNVENYIEMFLIISIACINATNETEQNQLFAIIILLATFELVFLFGNLPLFTIYIVMLRRVFLSFFKLFCIYFIIILAFASSFFLLFGKPCHTLPDFKNYWKTLFRTFIMLTGEFNSSDLEFDENPLISRVIFLLFVFCFAIVLLNLVNGLAVSDIQEIRKEAELVSLIDRAKYMSYVEYIFFNLPSTIIYFLQKYVYKNRGDLKSLLREHISLFPTYLKENKLEIYPYKNGLIKLDYTNRSKDCKRKRKYLQQSIVDSANRLIQTNRNQESERREYLDIYRSIIKDELYLSLNSKVI